MVRKTLFSGNSGLKLAGIMFLDIRDYSKLSQIQLEGYIHKVLPALAEIINPYRDWLKELNTWGDAIIAVSEDPVKLARLALDIRDYFRKTNFEAIGLPNNLRSRISLHAGTVMYGYDPIRTQTGITGSNVNLAARIEPIIIPGEIWSTQEFAQMLDPHAAAEQLAFDDVGSKELVKGLGSRELLRLRRVDESEALPTDIGSTTKATRALSNLKAAFDVIGIGALNTDYIASVTSLKKLKPDLIAEHEQFFELGSERVASKNEVLDVINQIGRSVLSVFLGGSSFNTIHALAQALPELRLGFVGVSGTSKAEIGFVDTLKSMKVDVSCVRSSSSESGICVSYITRGERSLLTWPGANIELGSYLKENRSLVVATLGRTRLVHVTSLFDSESPPVLASIIREAKDQNPWLQVSFDPGHDWVRRIKTREQSDAIREIMNLSSYLFLNRKEYELLASDLGLKDDQDLAHDIFQYLSSQAVLILLKRYDEIRVYHRLHKKLKEIRFLNAPIVPSQIEDATGAGDVFAAGLFIAIMVPGLELKDGIELGLRMVSGKLSSDGSSDYSSFTRIVDEYVDTVYAHRE